jgi:hypothetical protein
MKNGVFLDVTPCGSCKNRRFGGTQRLLLQGDKNRWTRNNASSNYQLMHTLRSVRQLLVRASVVPSSSILVTMMKEALSSSETSVPARVTQQNSREDAILLGICTDYQYKCSYMLAHHSAHCHVDNNFVSVYCMDRMYVKALKQTHNNKNKMVHFVQLKCILGLSPW